MNPHDFRASRPLAQSGLKRVRPPKYVTQVLNDGNKVMRVKKQAQTGANAFQLNKERRKKASQLKQMAVKPTSFVVVGNRRDESADQREHDQLFAIDDPEPHETLADLNLAESTIPRESSPFSDSLTDCTDKSGSFEGNEAMTLNLASVSTSKHRTSVTRSRRDEFEQQKTILERLVNTGGNQWRKPSVPLTLQKATLLGLTGGSSHSSSAYETTRSILDDLNLSADEHFLSKIQAPNLLRADASSDTGSQETTKLPAIEKVTLETEVTRYKSTLMPDFTRDIFLGKLSVLRTQIAAKNAPSIGRGGKTGEENPQQPAEARKLPMTVSRAITHAHEEMFLREPCDHHHCEHHSCSSGMHGSCNDLQKRESSCLKNTLLPPLPRFATIASIEAPAVPPPPKAEEAPARKELTSSVDSSRSEWDSNGDSRKIVRQRSNSILWSSGTSIKRRHSRSFPNEKTMVRRNSKGKLKPMRRASIPDRRGDKNRSEEQSSESSPEFDQDDFQEMQIHPLEEEPTQIESSRLNPEEEPPAATHRSHRSARSARSARSRAMVNGVSRLSFVPPPAETETELPLSGRASRVQSQADFDSKTSRVSTVLRGMLRQFKTYVQPHEDRIIIIPRNELLERFRKLDSDSDGHITYSQLESSLPPTLTAGQKQFVKAIYNLSVQATYFGFEEFSGVHAMCGKLESLKSAVAAQAFELIGSFSLESAIEFFLDIYEEVFSTLEIPRSLRKDPKLARVPIEKLLDAFNSNDTLSNSSDYADSSQRANDNAPEQQLQIIRSVFQAEDLSKCDHIQFLVHIPLFLALFKPERFKNQVTKKHRTLMSMY